MSEGIWVRRTSLVIVHADKKSFNGLLKVLKVEKCLRDAIKADFDWQTRSKRNF